MKEDNSKRALSGQKLFLLEQLSVPIGTIGTEGKGKTQGIIQAWNLNLKRKDTGAGGNLWL